jgi:hypothetical protein
MLYSESTSRIAADCPPIREHRQKESATEIKAGSLAALGATPESRPSNLLIVEANPERESLPQEPVTRPASSSSVPSSASLMQQYSVALANPIRDPPISGPIPLSFSNPVIAAVLQQFSTPAPSPPPSRNHTPSSFQFGVEQSFVVDLNNNNNNNGVGGAPRSMGQVSSQSLNSWQTFAQIASISPPLMGGTRNSPVSSSTADFPPLYSITPSFWEPVVRLPEPTPAPPTSAPPIPSLEQLACREDGRGENFTDEVLKGIILKAQPHHTNDSIAHLTRAQLTKHVDDLVEWWKTVNAGAVANLHSRQISPPSSTPAPIPVEQTSGQTVSTSSPRSGPQSLKSVIQTPLATPPPSPIKPQEKEKVIGQCPCCCDATQNAAFAPCGHLYACTACAHRLYDSGRGKCPVCRVPIQTYLKIFPTS